MLENEQFDSYKGISASSQTNVTISTGSDVTDSSYKKSTIGTHIYSSY